MLSEVSQSQRDKHLRLSSGDWRESCPMGDECRDETRGWEWGGCCSLGTESHLDRGRQLC